MKFRKGYYIKVFYNDGYSIGKITSVSGEITPNKERGGYNFWMSPLLCNSDKMRWIMEGYTEVYQSGRKIKKLTKDDVLVELL